MSGEATLPDSVADAAAEQNPAKEDAKKDAKDVKSDSPAAPKKNSEKPLSGVTLRRAELVHGATTGESVKYNQFPEDRPHDETGREITLRQETVDRYNTFLETHVTDLNKMAEKPAPPGSTANNLLEHVLQDPSKRSDKLVMDLLSKQVVGTDGKTITRTVNEEALKAFLGTGKEDNWAIATQLMEQDALWVELGAGIDVTVNPPIYNGQPSGKLEGSSSAIFDQTSTLRSLAKTGLSKTAVGLAALGYSVFGKGKTELELKNDTELLDAIIKNASPTDRAYLAAKTGIDIDQIIIISGTPWGVPTPTQAVYKEGYQPNREDLEKRIANAYSARKDFLTQLGIDEPPTRRGGREVDRSVDVRFPEEFIFDRGKHPEGLSVRYSMEIMKEYQDIVGTASNKYEYLRAMAQAREIVMVRYLERQIALEKTGKEGENITALKDKKEKMDNSPAELTAEKKRKLDKEKTESEERKTKAEEKRVEAQARKDAITTGETSLANVNQAALDLENEIIRDFEITLGDNFEALVGAKIKTLEGEIDIVDTALETAESRKADALGRYIKDIAEKNSLSQKEIADALKALAASGSVRGAINIPPAQDLGPIIALAEKTVGYKHDRKIQKKEAEREKKQEELDKLKKKYSAYTESVKARERAVGDIASKEAGQIKAKDEAYLKFRDPAAPLCTEDELQNLSADKLAEMLAGSPAAYAALDDEGKEKLLHTAITAKAEKASRLLEVAKPIPGYQLAALSAIGVLGISADDLTSTSLSELTARIIAGGTAMTPDIQKNLLDAQRGASRQLQSRYQSGIDVEIQYYEGIIKAEDEAIEKIDEAVVKLGDFREQIVELGAVITVMEGQAGAFARGYEAADSTEALESLSSDIKVSATDVTYSEAERDAGLEKGYYEWIRLLHPDYAKDPANRDNIFEAIHRVLPPEKLAELLNSSLSLGFTGTYKLDAVLNEINPAARRLGGPEIQLASKQIINYMRDRGLAL